MSAQPRQIVRIVGFAVIALLWALVLTLLLAVFLEYGGGLKFYQKIRYGELNSAQQFLTNLSLQYRPFAIQHINPFTLFSFPLSAEEREAISNETVHLTPDGYRGPGPDARGDRKLAFFIGGSTAFGHFATSDATTIPGYMDTLQHGYHFVNAAVPSWNTTQELHRMVDELLVQQPDLIVAFDGSNDVANAYNYAQEGATFPPGTPESFGALQARVDDIRGAAQSCEETPFLQRSFPQLSRHARNLLRSLFAPATPEQIEELSPERIDRLSAATAQKYLENVRIMHLLTKASGVRFAAVLQPVLELHEEASAEDTDRITLYRNFRQRVMEGKEDLPIYDFMSVFNEMEDAPALDCQQENLPLEQCIFVDNVHLTDRGNALIAERLLQILPVK